MAGSSGIGIALGVAGAAALLAAPFTGGATLYVYSAGILLAGASVAITAATAEKPEASSGVNRKLTTTADPETPWAHVFGHAACGGHVAWTGVAGDRDELTGIDIIISSEPTQAVTWVSVNEWDFPITTDPAGVSTTTGKGLILNGDRTAPPIAGGSNVAASFLDVPDVWYVPVYGSKWNRSDQTQNGHRPAADEAGRTDVPHIVMKINYGDQTATDTFMSTIFGTKYNSVARKFTGHTVAHIIVRGHTELGTLGNTPQIKWRLQGCDNLPLDDTGSSRGYSANAAAVFAWWLEDRFGIDPSDIVNHAGGGLDSLITECADVTWHSDNAQARYEYHSVARDDEDGVQIAQNIAGGHMCGGFSERGSKVVVWTGKIRSSVMDLGVADFAGPPQVEALAQDDHVNKLTPHYVPPFITDEDGNTKLYGSMEPMQPVGSATYVTEDDGQRLIKDIKFDGCQTSRRARWMALSALDAMRLGAQYTRRFVLRTIVLEPGDVVTLTDPDWVTSSTKFRVVRKRGPFADFSVELVLQRYEDAIYTQATVSEDAIGVLSRSRSSIMPDVENLAVQIVGPGRVGVTGASTVDVLVTWDEAANLAVNAGGGIEIEWKLAAADWPGNSAKAGGGATSKVLSGLLDDTGYELRARFYGTPTAGRPDRPIGDWIDPVIAFTPSLAAGGIYRPVGPPLGAVDGVNLLSDPYVIWRYSSDEGDGVKLGGFTITNADSAGNTPTGRVYTVSGVGFWTVSRNGVPTLTSVEMTVNGDAGDSVRFTVLEYLRIRPGQILQVGSSLLFDTTGQLECRVLFYDSDQGFLGSVLAFQKSTAMFGAGEWFQMAAPIVVRDIDATPASFARLQYRHVQLASHSSTPTTANLVARWKFDNNVADSVNGYDGVPIGSPTYETGTISQAIRLNGTSDYVDFGDQDALLADGYSYTIWVGADGTTGQRGIISKLNNVPPYDGILVEQNEADLKVYIDGAAPKLTVTGYFADTAQHLLSVVLDSGTVRIYKGSTEVGTGSYTTVTNPVGTPFLLGRQNNLGRFHDGTLDDGRVYDAPLSSGEIDDLANLVVPIGQVPEKINIDGMTATVVNKIDRLYDPDESWTITTTNWVAVASLGEPLIGSVDIGGTGYLAGGDGFWSNGTMSAIFTVDAEVHTEVVASGGTSAVTYAEFSLILIDATYPHWEQNTVYAIGDKVRAHGFAEPERIYVCDQAGTSASSGNGPSGTGTNITDNTARWDYDSDVTVIQLGPTAVKKKSRMPASSANGTVNEDVAIRYHTRSGPDLLGEGARIARLRCRLSTPGDTTRVQAVVTDIRMSLEIDLADVEAAA